MDQSVPAYRDTPGHRLLAAAGEVEENVEDAAVAAATSGVYRFRHRHPLVYGLIAFVIGAAIIAAFVVIGFSNWSFEGINLLDATYEFVFGSLGGGIVAVALAFAYARALRPVVKARRNILTPV